MTLPTRNSRYTAYDPGQAVPVSSRVFRLARTAGQLAEVQAETTRQIPVFMLTRQD